MLGILAKQRKMKSILGTISFPEVSLAHLRRMDFPHPYQMDQSTFILGASGVIFFYFSPFLMKFISANRIATDVTLPFARLPMSHKKDDRLIWISVNF